MAVAVMIDIPGGNQQVYEADRQAVAGRQAPEDWQVDALAMALRGQMSLASYDWLLPSQVHRRAGWRGRPDRCAAETANRDGRSRPVPTSETRARRQADQRTSPGRMVWRAGRLAAAPTAPRSMATRD